MQPYELVLDYNFNVKNLIDYFNNSNTDISEFLSNYGTLKISENINEPYRLKNDLFKNYNLNTLIIRRKQIPHPEIVDINKIEIQTHHLEFESIDTNKYKLSLDEIKAVFLYIVKNPNLHIPPFKYIETLDDLFVYDPYIYINIYDGNKLFSLNQGNIIFKSNNTNIPVYRTTTENVNSILKFITNLNPVINKTLELYFKKSPYVKYFVYEYLPELKEFIWLKKLNLI